MYIYVYIYIYIYIYEYIYTYMTIDTERMEAQRRADLVTAEKQLKSEKVRFELHA